MASAHADNSTATDTHNALVPINDKDKRDDHTAVDAIECDVVVVGSGPAGMLAALALAKQGQNIILLGPQVNKHDVRTTALMMPAINYLQQMDVWQELEPQAAALSTMRIVDGTKRLIRAPIVDFRASEIGEYAFGYNMPNVALNTVLEQRVRQTETIRWIEDVASHYHHQDNRVIITTAEQKTLQCKLVVAADGRASPARDAAGITTKTWQYPQIAVVLSFAHQLPHKNISTEFHTEHGPFTQVPLPGNNSSLVWVCKPDKANQLLGLGEKALALEIEQRMQSMLGPLTITASPHAWPLGGAIPRQFAANRIILIGEAAHVFPPIGAQGLNLGVRDVQAVVDVVQKNGLEDQNIDALIAAYNHDRRPDIWMRTNAVDALNRILLSNFLPAQMVRAAGLEILRNFTPLRGLFMREGMYPGNGLKTAFCSLLPKRPSFLGRDQQNEI